MAKDAPAMTRQWKIESHPANLRLVRKELEEFADCIRGNQSPLVDGRFGARSVKLTEELYARRAPLSRGRSRRLMASAMLAACASSS